MFVSPNVKGNILHSPNPTKISHLSQLDLVILQNHFNKIVMTDYGQTRFIIYNTSKTIY